MTKLLTVLTVLVSINLHAGCNQKALDAIKSIQALNTPDSETVGDLDNITVKEEPHWVIMTAVDFNLFQSFEAQVFNDAGKCVVKVIKSNQVDG